MVADIPEPKKAGGDHHDHHDHGGMGGMPGMGGMM
jgi:chaperonin GroEL